MEKSANEIDQIIRNKVLDYEEDPSPGFWRRISRRLSPNDSYRWTLVIVALLSVLGFWMMKSESKEPGRMSETEIIMEQTTGAHSSAASVEPKEDRITKLFVAGQEELNENPPERAIIQAVAVKQDDNNQDEIVSNNSNTAETFRDIYLLTELDKKQADQVTAGFIAIQDTPQPINNGISNEDKLFTGNPTTKFKGPGRWSLSMEVGYAHAWRSMSAEPQFDDFKNRRIQNETISNPISYDFKINYQYKNWLLSVGLGYMTYGEKLHYQLSETVVDPEGGYYDVDSLWMPNYNAENNYDPILIGYNTTWVDEYKQLFYGVENTNLYHYIEIPVSIGYRFNHNSFSVSPSVGMSLGILYQASGRLLTSNSGAFEEISKNSDFLQSNVNNVSFGLSLEYLVTPNYGLYIKPFYKQGLNSIYKNYPLSASFRNAGFKIGINIYL